MPDDYASLRPVVKVEGSDLSAEQYQALTGIRVVKGLGTPAYAQLSFTVPSLSPGIDIDVGDDIVVKVDGLKDADDWEIFDGVVVGTGIDLASAQDQVLIVEAYDRLHELGRTSVAKTWVDKSTSDAVKGIVEAAGDLTVEIAAGALPTTEREATYQYGTAYSFVDRVVREAGAEWFVENSTLHIRPRTKAGGSSVKLQVGEDLLAFSARFTAADRVKEVTVTGWDPKTKEPIVGTHSSSGAEAVSGIESPTADAVDAFEVGGITQLSIPRPVTDQNEAEHLAKGIVKRRDAQMLRARGRVTPNPSVMPGSAARPRWVSHGSWDGTYYCTQVEHTWGGRVVRHVLRGRLDRTRLAAGPHRRVVDQHPRVADRRPDGGHRHREQRRPRPPRPREAAVAVSGRRSRPLVGPASSSWAPAQSAVGTSSPKSTTKCSSGSRTATSIAPMCSVACTTAWTSRPPLTPVTRRWTTGSDGPPRSRSRNGHEMLFADGSSPGDTYVQISTKGRQARLYLGDREDRARRPTGSRSRCPRKLGALRSRSPRTVRSRWTRRTTSRSSPPRTSPSKGRTSTSRRRTSAKLEGATVDVKAQTKATVDRGVKARRSRARDGEDQLMSDPSDFIGRGISFPLRVDQSGSIATTSGRRRHRLLDPHGPHHRARRAPDASGFRLQDLGAAVRADQRQHARPDGRGGHAKRSAGGSRGSTLDDVRLDPDRAATPVRCMIEIDYVVRATNDRRNLVYPFYVIPREDES